jgi:hypothetical protein
VEREVQYRQILLLIIEAPNLPAPRLHPWWRELCIDCESKANYMKEKMMRRLILDLKSTEGIPSLHVQVFGFLPPSPRKSWENFDFSQLSTVAWTTETGVKARHLPVPTSCRREHIIPD